MYKQPFIPENQVPIVRNVLPGMGGNGLGNGQARWWMPGFLFHTAELLVPLPIITLVMP